MRLSCFNNKLVSAGHVAAGLRTMFLCISCTRETVLVSEVWMVRVLRRKTASSSLFLFLMARMWVWWQELEWPQWAIKWTMGNGATEQSLELPYQVTSWGCYAQKKPISPLSLWPLLQNQSYLPIVNSCQGCISSPCLFNLYAEYIMRNAGLDEA